MDKDLNWREVGSSLLLGLAQIRTEGASSTAARPKARVFLSYAREDQERVNDLYRRLSDAGYEPWMDVNDLIGGERYERAIQEAIHDADFFLFCCSTRSVKKRGFLRREIRRGLDVLQEKLEEDIYFIPVRLDDCETPEELRAFQWINFFEKDATDRLVKALQVGIERRTDGAIVEGPSSDRITPIIFEVLAQDLEDNEGPNWETDAQEIVCAIKNALNQQPTLIQPAERLIALASLTRLLKPEALKQLKAHSDCIEATPGYDDPEGLDRFWKHLVESVRSAGTAAIEKTLLDVARELQSDGQQVIGRWISGIPISPRLVAMLDVGREACERNNLPYRSAQMLHSLLAFNSNFAAECFDVIDAGLANQIRKRLYSFITKEHTAHEAGMQYERVEWDRHEIVRDAKRRAFSSGYPVANEKYLLLALLESRAGTIESLQHYIDDSFGSGSFSEIYEYAKTHSASPGQVGRTPPIEW